MDVLDPIPHAAGGPVTPLAPRPRDLRGLRIGVLDVGPEHARTVADSGWSKADLQRALWERGRVRMDAFSAENVARYRHIVPGRFDATAPDATVIPTLAADDIVVMVAGGPGKHSVVPTFGATRSVTVRIDA
jgi:hypothetical protein